MRALLPWTGMTDLKQEMDRLFDRFFEWGDGEMAPLGQWTPKVDIHEGKDQLVVEAEVPGIQPSEIEVSLEDNVLTLKGEKRQEKEEKDARSYRREVSYGSFLRRLPMPVPVDAGAVTATFKNGMLTVTLPKAPAAKGTTIAVKAA